MKIEALLATAPHAKFELTTLELDDPRDDEILVKISAVGLCHTDIVFRDQPTGLALPAVLGHEGAGVVERVGASVTKVAPGDHVLITFRSCGTCRRCVKQDPAYCEHMPLMNYAGRRPDGSSPIGEGKVSSNFFGQSSFASHALTYERNVVKLSDDLSLATYAPLGCGVQTGAGAIMRSLDCQKGESVVVVGAGTVGLSAVLAATVRGCSPIIVVEPVAERRNLALELGATHALDPFAGDIVAAVRGIVALGVDYVLDASGAVPAIQAAINYLAPKGVLGLVGVPPANSVLTVAFVQLITFGLGVRGIIEGDSDPDIFLPELIQLHKEGRFPFERLITTYRYDKINEAIEDQEAGKVVKVVLTFD